MVSGRPRYQAQKSDRPQALGTTTQILGVTLQVPLKGAEWGLCPVWSSGYSPGSGASGWGGEKLQRGRQELFCPPNSPTLRPPRTAEKQQRVGRERTKQGSPNPCLQGLTPDLRRAARSTRQGDPQRVLPTPHNCPCPPSPRPPALPHLLIRQHLHMAPAHSPELVLGHSAAPGGVQILELEGHGAAVCGHCLVQPRQQVLVGALGGRRGSGGPRHLLSPLGGALGRNGSDLAVRPGRPAGPTEA